MNQSLTALQSVLHCNFEGGGEWVSTYVAYVVAENIESCGAVVHHSLYVTSP